jgi:hypothetical protein
MTIADRSRRASPIDALVARLEDVFRRHPDKREAHARSRPLLEEVSHDPRFLAEALERHLRKPGALDRLHYPVVAVEVGSSPHFVLVLNCWIALPSRDTALSTKAIHHHGGMLLSTTTVFGPGYEHWMFTLPERRSEDVCSMKLLEVAPHPLHNVSFVDSWTCHLPLYPPSLTITLALWSSEKPTTWKDHVKRIPLLERNAGRLRKLALRAGLAGHLDLKVVENFDFCPVENGFRQIRERIEFKLGPNDDYLQSLFHVIQETGNQQLSRTVHEVLRSTPVARRNTLERLAADLEQGRSIGGKLSAGHYDVPFANFSRSDIERALKSLGAKEPHGGKLASS